MRVKRSCKGSADVTKMMSRDALQRLLLEQLKAVPGCEGARCVVITIPASARTGGDAGATARIDAPNWRIGIFDSGTSSIGACRKAIAEIEARLAQDYTVTDNDRVEGREPRYRVSRS
jgi:hypothetical protein